MTAVALPLSDQPVAGRLRALIGRHPVVRTLLLAAFALASLALLTAIYTRLSMTSPVSSDQANSALQGQDLWNGNVLMRGWTLSGISLYVPDLVLYAVVVAIHGLQPSSVHVVNALMYAMLVVAAVVLARGPASTKSRAVAGLITAALLIAPQLGLGVSLLLLDGSHIGVTLLVVLAFIVLDQAPGRYAGLFIVTGIFTVAVVSDGLVDVIGVAPVVAVCAWRLARRSPESRYDAGLLVAAAAAIPLGTAILFAIRRVHGFYTYPLAPALAHPSDIPSYIGSAVRGILGLFGANITSASGPLDYIAAGVHGIGLLFAVGIACVVAWQWLQRKQVDRVSELLLAAMAVDALAFLVIAHGDTNRYLIPLFVFGSILAGRAGAGLLAQRRLTVPAAAVAAAYCAILLVSLLAPPAPTTKPWDAWLLEHHLYYGVGSYWQASSITLETEGRVQVRPILSDGKTANGYAWESKAGWYVPEQLGDVRFVVFDDNDQQFGISRVSMQNVFGAPAQVQRFGSIEVWVWDRNLVPSMNLGPA